MFIEFAAFAEKVRAAAEGLEEGAGIFTFDDAERT